MGEFFPQGPCSPEKLAFLRSSALYSAPPSLKSIFYKKSSAIIIYDWGYFIVWFFFRTLNEKQFKEIISLSKEEINSKFTSYFPYFEPFLGAIYPFCQSPRTLDDVNSWDKNDQTTPLKTTPNSIMGSALNSKTDASQKSFPSLSILGQPITSPATIRIVGSDYCSTCHEVKSLFDQAGIHYSFIEATAQNTQYNGPCGNYPSYPYTPKIYIHNRCYTQNEIHGLSRSGQLNLLKQLQQSTEIRSTTPFPSLNSTLPLEKWTTPPSFPDFKETFLRNNPLLGNILNNANNQLWVTTDNGFSTENIVINQENLNSDPIKQLLATTALQASYEKEGLTPAQSIERTQNQVGPNYRRITKVDVRVLNEEVCNDIQGNLHALNRGEWYSEHAKLHNSPMESCWHVLAQDLTDSSERAPIKEMVETLKTAIPLNANSSILTVIVTEPPISTPLSSTTLVSLTSTSDPISVPKTDLFPDSTLLTKESPIVLSDLHITVLQDLLTLTPAPTDPEGVIQFEKFKTWLLLSPKADTLYAWFTPDGFSVLKLIIDKSCSSLIMEHLINQGLALDTPFSSLNGTSLRTYLSNQCDDNYRMSGLLSFYPDQTPNYRPSSAYNPYIQATRQKTLEDMKKEERLLNQPSWSETLVYNAADGAAQGGLIVAAEIISERLQRNSSSPFRRWFPLVVSSFLQAVFSLMIRSRILGPTIAHDPDAEEDELSFSLKQLSVYFFSLLATGVLLHTAIECAQKRIKDHCQNRPRLQKALLTSLPYLSGFYQLSSALLSQSTYIYASKAMAGFFVNITVRGTTAALLNGVRSCWSFFQSRRSDAASSELMLGATPVRTPQEAIEMEISQKREGNASPSQPLIFRLPHRSSPSNTALSSAYRNDPSRQPLLPQHNFFRRGVPNATADYSIYANQGSLGSPKPKNPPPLAPKPKTGSAGSSAQTDGSPPPTSIPLSVSTRGVVSTHSTIEHPERVAERNSRGRSGRHNGIALTPHFFSRNDAGNILDQRPPLANQVTDQEPVLSVAQRIARFESR